MINIAVVDDEIEFQKQMESFLQKAKNEIGNIYEYTIFSNAFDFLEYNKNFDLIFFDINMPLLNGYEAVKKIRDRGDNAVVVFITNLAQFAIKGYEVDASDFILKPIQYDDFLYRLKKALNKCNYNEMIISIEYKGIIKKLPLSAIYYLESQEHITIIHTKDGNYEVRKSLKYYENLLKNNDFYKCNYSCLINLKYVDKIIDDKIIINNETIYMSRNRKKTFIERFKKY